MAQSSSKSPELLARYCDSLLKKRYVLKDRWLLFSKVLAYEVLYCFQKQNFRLQEINCTKSWVQNFSGTIPEGCGVYFSF